MRAPPLVGCIVWSLYRKLSPQFVLALLFICVILHNMWSGKSPQFLCILPFGVLGLSAISRMFVKIIYFSIFAVIFASSALMFVHCLLPSQSRLHIVDLLVWCIWFCCSCVLLHVDIYGLLQCCMNLVCCSCDLPCCFCFLVLPPGI